MRVNMCFCEFICTTLMPETMEARKRGLYPLEYGATMWVLGTGPWSCARAASALYHWASSPAPFLIVLPFESSWFEWFNITALFVSDAAVRFCGIALKGSEAEQKPISAQATHLSESLEQRTSDNFWAEMERNRPAANWILALATLSRALGYHLDVGTHFAHMILTFLIFTHGHAEKMMMAAYLTTINFQKFLSPRFRNTKIWRSEKKLLRINERW